MLDRDLENFMGEGYNSCFDVGKRFAVNSCGPTLLVIWVMTPWSLVRGYQRFGDGSRGRIMFKLG